MKGDNESKSCEFGVENILEIENIVLNEAKKGNTNVLIADRSKVFLMFIKNGLDTTKNLIEELLDDINKNLMKFFQILFFTEG